MHRALSQGEGVRENERCRQRVTQTERDTGADRWRNRERETHTEKVGHACSRYALSVVKNEKPARAKYQSI